MEKRIILDQTLGNYLKELRNGQKMSIEALSRKISIAKSMISYIEHGKRMPSIDALYIYADFFKVDFNVLMNYRLITIKNTVEKLGDATPYHIKNEFHLLHYDMSMITKC